MGQTLAEAFEFSPVRSLEYIPDISNQRVISACHTPVSHLGDDRWMEWKMVKLGRVSKETRGAILPQMIEDLVVRNDGNKYPKI